MRNFHLRKNQHHLPAVNLDKLWTLVTEQTKEKYADHPEKKVPVIDCVRAVSYLRQQSASLYFLHSMCRTGIVSTALGLSTNDDDVGCAQGRREILDQLVLPGWTSFLMSVSRDSPNGLTITFNWYATFPWTSVDLSCYCSSTGLLQGARQGCPPQAARYCQGQVLLKGCPGEDQGGRWSLCVVRLSEFFSMASLKIHTDPYAFACTSFVGTWNTTSCAEGLVTCLGVKFWMDTAALLEKLNGHMKAKKLTQNW